MNVRIDNGTVVHAYAQLTAEGLGAWLRDALEELGQTRLRRVGESRPAFPRQRGPVSGIPRKESTNAVRLPSEFRGDLHSYVAHQQQSFKGARNAQGPILQRDEKALRVRERGNTENDHTAEGTRVEVGNPVLVKDTNHKHWTRPFDHKHWIRPFGPKHWIRPFGHEFAHLAWGEVLGLAEPSTVASPVHTLADREAVRGGGGSWVWRLKDQHFGGRNRTG